MPAADAPAPGQSTSLDRLFRPRSVAIVGASSNAEKIGGIPVAYLKSFGFSGTIHPVNPNATEIQGLASFPTLRDIPGAVDLAIVAVPAARVEATVHDAAAAGVKGLVIFSSGFAEAGGDGQAAQARITEAARQAGVRLLGPNCLGCINVAEDLYATFSPALKLGKPRPGDIAIVSQSGAFGAYALTLANRRGLGVSHWITTGNEADIDFAECVEWLAGDDQTRVIVGYMEGCRDGARLRRALAAAEQAGKPVVLTKVGRSASGAQAAASHTAALAGEDAVFDGVFRQHCVLRADSIEACFDMAYAAAIAARPSGRHVGLFTVSGGAGVLMADEATDQGMLVPELSARTQQAVLEMVPFAAARNPLDITGQVVNVENAMRESLAAMARDGACNAIVAFLAVGGLSPVLGPALAADVASVRAEVPDVPIYVVTLASDPVRAQFEAAGCPVFDDPNRAVRALAALARLGARAGAPAAPAATDLPRSSRALPRTSTEPEALAILQSAGLPTVACRLVTTAEEAGNASQDFGVPVAVKIVSPDILHKTDIGGVRLGLTGASATTRAARDILAAASQRAPDARIQGLLVAPMTAGVAECVIGVQRDPVFGPVVMFGLGGVHIEALRDVTFRAAPIDEHEARRMIGEVRALRLLTAPRGSAPADLDALAQAIADVSRFAAAHADSLESLDLNPVIVKTAGNGVTIVDALLIGR